MRCSIQNDIAITINQRNLQPDYGLITFLFIAISSEKQKPTRDRNWVKEDIERLVCWVEENQQKIQYHIILPEAPSSAL